MKRALRLAAMMVHSLVELKGCMLAAWSVALKVSRRVLKLAAKLAVYSEKTWAAKSAAMKAGYSAWQMADQSGYLLAVQSARSMAAEMVEPRVCSKVARLEWRTVEMMDRLLAALKVEQRGHPWVAK
jgi:hypothetical protein